MKLKKIINEIILQEGVYDKGILKAFFLAGGPGSGKSYVSSKLFGFNNSSFSSMGLKYVDQDKLFVQLLKKMDINPKNLASIAKDDPDHFNYLTNDPSGPRSKGADITDKIKLGYQTGRLGLVIDGTGGNFQSIKEKYDILNSAGYTCYMIFVNTDLETAKKRNSARDRTLPDDVVVDKWKAVQNNLGKFQNLFGDKLIILDNTEGSENILNSVSKKIRKLVSSPVENPIGKHWIDSELKNKNRNQ